MKHLLVDAPKGLEMYFVRHLVTFDSTFEDNNLVITDLYNDMILSTLNISYSLTDVRSHSPHPWEPNVFAGTPPTVLVGTPPSARFDTIWNNLNPPLVNIVRL